MQMAERCELDAHFLLAQKKNHKYDASNGIESKKLASLVHNQRNTRATFCQSGSPSARPTLYPIGGATTCLVIAMQRNWPKPTTDA